MAYEIRPLHTDDYANTIYDEPRLRLITADSSNLFQDNDVTDEARSLQPYTGDLATTLSIIISQKALQESIPSSFNGYEINQENPDKVTVHAPNSEAFIELMTPEKPDDVTLLCQQATDLLKQHGRRLKVNGELALVIPYPYRFSAPHIPNAEPQYTWLAFLANPESDKEVLPSIIFTRDPAVKPNLETPHTRDGKKIGTLGFWEHNSQMHLVALGESITGYNKSNTPGDVEDVAEIIAGIKTSVMAQKADQEIILPEHGLYVSVGPAQPIDTLEPDDELESLFLFHTTERTTLSKSLRFGRRVVALYAGFSTVIGVAGTVTESEPLSEIAVNILYAATHPNESWDILVKPGTLPGANEVIVEKQPIDSTAACDPTVLTHGKIITDRNWRARLAPDPDSMVPFGGKKTDSLSEYAAHRLCRLATSYERTHPSEKTFSVKFSLSSMKTLGPDAVITFTDNVDLNR